MLVFWQVMYWLGTIADWYTTKRLVLDKEAAREVNPAINWLIQKLEKPGKEDMIDFGFQKMHKAEIALLLLKIALGVTLHMKDAGWVTWMLSATPLLLVACSNKWGWTSKVIRWWKNRRG